MRPRENAPVKRNGPSRNSASQSQAANGQTAGRPVNRRSVAPRVLKDIIARVVAAAQPDRIILFGSAARSAMGPNSDVDLLVIKGGKFNRGNVTTAIYRHLYGADAAVDVVVVTPEEVERYRDTPCL